MAETNTGPVDELARLQQLSNAYVPDVKGDFVGNLTSTHAITAEYAKADATYINKTQAIPLSYSHYRPILGDGNCGWRAIAFGYFEALRCHGEPFHVQAELARLKSTDNLLKAVGYEATMYEDWAEETFNLLTKISNEVSGPDEGQASVFEAFNNQEVMSSIIMHFRIITSAWLKTNVDSYQPFCQDASIEHYCTSKIDPFQIELEHLGLQALVDAIIKPAQISLEVSCLDLSPGTEMNVLKWHIDDAAPLVGTIRLLYRPGHYDILYKEDDTPVSQKAPQIHRVSYTDPTFAATPGFPYPGLGGEYLPISHVGISPWTNTVGYPIDGSYPSSFVSAASAPYGQPTVHPTPGPQATCSPASSTSQIYVQPRQARPRLSSSPHAGHPAVTGSGVSPNISTLSPTIHKSEDPFRKSIWDLQFAAGSGDLPFRGAPRQDPCTTEAMLKSGEGKNHYMNPNFEPEPYDPENKEERLERGGSGSGNNGGSSGASFSSKSPRSGKGSRRGSNH